MRRGARRAVALTAVATCCLVGTAHADPPGPTDYQSRVVAITPAVDGLAARIIGGDSFFQLTVTAPVEVVVIGYRGEPYLRFLPGGEVQEKERSPTRFLNTSRYATSAPSPEADPDADPVWRTVAHDGQWAWHDHRTHWMNTARPPGRRPGDQILEAVIPLLVDSAPVSVTVTSTWMPAPSNVPAVLGALLGAGAGIGAIALRVRRPRLAAGTLALGAAGALVVGLSQTWSVPGQTGPPLTAWALPLTALAVGVGGVVRRWSSFTSATIVLVAAVQLVLWAVLRRDGLVRAILPTDAPFWLDRALTAGVGALAVLVGSAAAAALARMLAGRPAQSSASM